MCWAVGGRLPGQIRAPPLLLFSLKCHGPRRTRGIGSCFPFWIKTVDRWNFPPLWGHDRWKSRQSLRSVGHQEASRALRLRFPSPRISDRSHSRPELVTSGSAASTGMPRRSGERRSRRGLPPDRCSHLPRSKRHRSHLHNSSGDSVRQAIERGDVRSVCWVKTVFASIAPRTAPHSPDFLLSCLTLSPLQEKQCSGCHRALGWILDQTQRS